MCAAFTVMVFTRRGRKRVIQMCAEVSVMDCCDVS